MESCMHGQSAFRNRLGHCTYRALLGVALGADLLCFVDGFLDLGVNLQAGLAVMP